MQRNPRGRLTWERERKDTMRIATGGGACRAVGSAMVLAAIGHTRM